ncbi:MAG: TonB family protein [Acidobacteria bacterium]|nr:TonB family protein [Acidobacteriota bacterium]
MGKILKYCSSCDEGFADKFQFCPNCGEALQAFEMNPVAAEPKALAKKAEPKAPATREIKAVEPPAPTFIEPTPETTPVEEASAPVEEAPAVHEPPVVEAAPPHEAEIAPEEPVVEAPAIEEPVVAATTAASAPVFCQSAPMYADEKPASFEEAHSQAQRDGGYYLTVIEEKNVGTRNGLLLGATVFMGFVLLSGLVINIFSKDLDVGSIDDAMFNAVLVDDVPVTTEEQQQQKKDKDAGGGGGGGRQQDETTQGDLANQTKNPLRPPEAVDRHDFELKDPPASSQGDRTFEQKFDRYGDPNGRFTSWNNGSGTGGGQGNGTGTGQGNGRGTGAGNGTGSGYGNGLGNGNGNGTGDGPDGGPPPRAVGESSPMKLISKPKPGYTAEARQANFTGTVLLRVTFLASGQIGGVSAVKGAPYGLTESAIAAAKRISFEPAKVNGVPQTVTKSIEYSFTLY